LPYLFAIFSNTKPHKGLSDLLAAYREFREGRRWTDFATQCPSLVLAGFGVHYLVDSPEGEALLKANEGVRVVGSLSDGELRRSLRGARALIVPSLVEGFCLPAVEAQAVGTPVVCRPVPALLELVGEQDTVADSFSVGSLSNAIGEGLRKANSSARLVPHAHLELYSCAKVASMVKSEYERILSARSAS
jgi:glycosyltransferase involved in cell wall biosynthesis